MVWAALVAALVAGLLTTLLLHTTAAPLIAQAEIIEHQLAAGDGNHVHGAPAAWEPEDGMERIAYTALTTTLAAFGYALLLGAALTRLGVSGVRAGLALGAAGFLVFQLAPALGLPPRPPGVPMAELLPRQLWWWGTALATALALACWLRARNQAKGLWIIAGVAFAVLPHVIGAPRAPAETGAVPVSLVNRFAVTALLIAAVFWLTIGGVAGAMFGVKARRRAGAASLSSE